MFPDMQSAKRAEIERYAGQTNSLGGYHQPTTRERLEAQLVQLREATANVEAALTALDDNPGAEALLNALRKVGI